MIVSPERAIVSPKRAIVSFAVGRDYGRIAAITRPRLAAYAGRHGYALAYGDDVVAADDRPPSWRKLRLLLDLFGAFDELLWIDADVLIVDDSLDLADEIGSGAMQALAFHRDGAGSEIPNCGVWFLRRTLAPWLAEMDRRDDLVDHPWWEQAAMIELLGYQLTGRNLVATIAPSTINTLNRATHRLAQQWNDHPFDVTPRGAPRFVHVVGCAALKLARLESLTQ